MTNPNLNGPMAPYPHTAHPDAYQANLSPNWPAAPTAHYGTGAPPPSAYAMHTAPAPHGYPMNQTYPMTHAYTHPGYPTPAYGGRTIQVGQDGWTDALKAAVIAGETVDLVFSASQWQHYLDEYLNPALEAAGMPAFSMRYDPSSPAHAMALPALAVVAIVIAALIALIAVVSLVTSTVVSYHAMEKCYGVDIVEGGSVSGSGSADNGGSGTASGARVVRLTPGTGCR